MKKLPLVAVVGQANVGKSSLFNRLLKRREAIVAEEAGTTRDNVVRRVTINTSKRSQDFWLVDTAGLKTAEDEFEASIQEQITEAADAADVILVAVDSTKYINDLDRFVAKKALKSKKPVILIVNKVDLKNNLPNESFVKLGIKDIIRASAHHGIGINDLINRLSEVINNDLDKTYNSTSRSDDKDEQEDSTLKIALIGRPNAGKSHLFNTLAGKQQAIVANIAGTTRDINRISVKYHGREIELLDTAGVRRNGKIEVGIEKFSVLRTMQAINESDICLLLIDVNDLSVQLNQKLAGVISEAGKGLVLVVSKWDIAENRDAFTRDDLAHKISRQNVTKIFELALQIKSRQKQKLKTTELNKLLQSCIVKHPPAGLKNTHPRLRYIVQTDDNPPWLVVFGSNLKYLHWSYKRYLEKSLREKYDYTGTPVKFSFRDEKQIKQNKLKSKEEKD
jgi:GTP-binding protein